MEETTLLAPAVEEEERAEIEIDESEDVEPLKVMPDPGQPTAEQLELHRLTHWPFRSWCPWCVMGRARGAPHSASSSCTIAIVGLDYFYITVSGVEGRSELTEYPDTDDGNAALDTARGEGKIIKCIVVRDSKSKALFAHVVPRKGVDEEQYVVNLVAADLEWLGHTAMILKADNERSLQALVRAIIRRVHASCKTLEQVSKEEPAKYDSQSNGLTEVGVQLVRGHFRTLKVCLEARLEKYIPVNHAVVPWLLMHTCLLLNAAVRGPDGLTAWTRCRGRSFNQKLLNFGEKVLYKLPTKGPLSAPDGNMGTRWREGIFLGHNRSANVYIIGAPHGMVESRSLVRRPESDRWIPELLARHTATPWSERERPAQQVRFQPSEEGVGADVATAPSAAIRRMRLSKHDFEKHGYTEGCKQCEHMLSYGKPRPGHVHSDACRDRMQEAINSSETGKARVEQHEERVNRGIAEAIERTHPRRRSASPATALRRRRHDGPDARDTLMDPTRAAGPGGAAAARAAGADLPPVPSWKARRAHAKDADPTPRPTPAKGPPDQPRGGDSASRESGFRELRTDGRDRSGVQGATGVPAEEPPGETPRGAFTEPPSGSGPHENDDMDVDEAQVDPGHDVNMHYIGSLEPSYDDFVSQLMLEQLGAGKAYTRERRTASRRIVSELYSPPRITKMISEGRYKHVAPGFAFDLTRIDPMDGCPWDFSRRSKRNRARTLIREQKPYMLIGSPMCKAFSAWQRLNRARSSDKAAIDKAYEEACVHIRFVVELYREQIEGGRYFLHEHPDGASSWTLKCVEELLKVEGVQRVIGDQCQFGAEAIRGASLGSPIKKPTGFMTNSTAVAAALARRCQGTGGRCSRPQGGRHQQCSGQHARDAQVYPKGLCRAVLRGVTEQLRLDDLLKPGCYGIQVADDDAEIIRNMYGPAQGYSGAYKDDLTGQVLRDDLVKKARSVELTYFNSKGVWRKVARGRARAESGRPPISVRWVDVNKGDEMEPNYRSRLVARQMKVLDHSGQSFFAPAPPLEALRTVLSLAMTAVGGHRPDWDPRSPNRTQVSFIDVTRAYFNAVIDSRDAPTFVELPVKDEDHHDKCGLLLRHMYGTRGAADGWQEEYSTMLVRHGFRQGNACPNLFHHPEKGVVCSVHGDDFTSSGPKPALDWMEKVISEEYQITIGPRLGPGPQDAKEGRALNRVVRWCESHIEYEADPRQIERLITECGLEGAKSVVTPSVKATFRELEDDEELGKTLHTAFRGAAARGNYLAADRIDVQFACKEICRSMAHPTAHAWKSLKRLCRYLTSAPRLVYDFPQQVIGGIDVYTDTDWAGCPRTRKSTSGGVVMLGKHTMKHWSSTQTSTALSSGEAEFAGVIRGAGQGLGYQSLLHDLGIIAPLRVWTDSSAAIGICSRQGLGKMRHLDTHTLWIQQAVRSRRVDLRKVPGESNPADLLTKHSHGRNKLEQLVGLFGCRHISGRAESAPALRRGASAKMTIGEAKVEGTVGGDASSTGPDQLGMVADPIAQTPPMVADPMSGPGGPDDGSRDPDLVLPHTVYTETEMNELYPSLVAPPDEPLNDFLLDSADHVYQHGLETAARIQMEVNESGRRRHASYGTPGGSEPGSRILNGNPSTSQVSAGGPNGNLIGVPASLPSIAHEPDVNAVMEGDSNDAKKKLMSPMIRTKDIPPRDAVTSCTADRRRSAWMNESLSVVWHKFCCPSPCHC